MRLVILSDTHGLHHAIGNVPDGDVVIHAGDVTRRGTLGDISAFLEWFQVLPHRSKIFVAGNHDWAFEREPALAEALVPRGITYLRDSGLSIRRVKFWGAPWQPWFNNWAFNLQRGAEIAAKWALIPDDVQVLITHGHPHGILDVVDDPPAKHVGCEAMRERIAALPKLRLHAFGHVHEGYGAFAEDGRRYVNASICTLQYAPVNAPVVVDI